MTFTNPDVDPGTEILDPNFDTGTPWNFSDPWTYGPNFAHYFAGAPGPGDCNQANILTNPGSKYSITFTMSNVILAGPAGVIVKFGGETDGVLYQAAATHTAQIVTFEKSSILSFEISAIQGVDQCDIDTILISSAGNYIGDVQQIDWAKKRWVEILDVDGTRYNQTCAGKNGNTNCLIAFDL